MDKSRLTLFQVLIGKSIVEVLFVSALAAGFFYQAFPPYFLGWGEAKPHAIAGWAVNNAAPWDRVEVQLFIDENFIATSRANLSRPDVMQAGWTRDAWHGYAFPIPTLPAGDHEARIYAIHESGGGIRRTLQLLGYPIRFSVDEKGAVKDHSK